MFLTADGRSFGRTFLLMCALFLLSGLCNSMLDTLNKHFQNSFAINKMQSAFVQNAFYLGYFLMAIPAGLLARRLGYKGGILTGLCIITLGAFWFVPATRIGTYWALAKTHKTARKGTGKNRTCYRKHKRDPRIK